MWSKLINTLAQDEQSKKLAVHPDSVNILLNTD